MIEFTALEIKRAEKYFNIKWDELSILAKLSYGLTARTYLTPEGIANIIVYGEDVTQWPKS